ATAPRDIRPRRNLPVRTGGRLGPRVDCDDRLQTVIVPRLQRRTPECGDRREGQTRPGAAKRALQKAPSHRTPSPADGAQDTPATRDGRDRARERTVAPNTAPMPASVSAPISTPNATFAACARPPHCSARDSMPTRHW